MTKLHPQLTLQVDDHPALTDYDDPMLIGTLKVSLELNVTADLQRGDKLYVRIMDADAQEITTGVIEIKAVEMKDVKAMGSVIGTERLHKAKVTL